MPCQRLLRRVFTQCLSHAIDRQVYRRESHGHVIYLCLSRRYIFRLSYLNTAWIDTLYTHINMMINVLHIS